jgi:hypothetical protein
MRSSLRPWGLPAAAAVLVVLAAGGGYAIASSGGSTITACVHKHGGALYVGKCKKGDRALTWNKVGPAGKAGAVGSPGSQGGQGLQGITGQNGGSGASGATGATGPAGAPGTALAYALMNRSGTLQHVRNFSGYTNPATGEYCLVPSGGVTPAASPVALVSVEYESSATAALAAFVLEGAPDCPAGNYEVRTYNFSSTLSSNVAFYIVVPS